MVGIKKTLLPLTAICNVIADFVLIVYGGTQTFEFPDLLESMASTLKFSILLLPYALGTFIYSNHLLLYKVQCMYVLLLPSSVKNTLHVQYLISKLNVHVKLNR